MATYKVPQDVEAEDKLLGPLSFKQFIFLLIAVGLGALAYFLSTILIPLFIIPLPISLFFLILALPLKKDQPMEVYLAAIISFHIKPRKKIWQADGIINTVEFDNQITDKQDNYQELSYQEAKERLSFLSNVVDSQGMAVSNRFKKSSLQADVISESQQIEDIHDINNQTSQNFSQMIYQNNQQRKQDLINSVQNNNQFVIPTSPNHNLNKKPITSQTTQNTELDSKIPIHDLANNNDLSIETLSAEIKRRKQKKSLVDQENSSISLRR